MSEAYMADCRPIRPNDVMSSCKLILYSKMNYTLKIIHNIKMINMNIYLPCFNQKTFGFRCSFLIFMINPKFLEQLRNINICITLPLRFLQQITVGRKVEDVGTRTIFCALRIYNDDASILFKGIKGERVLQSIKRRKN